MCGIIAVVRRRSGRTPVDPATILDLLAPVRGLVADARDPAALASVLSAAAAKLDEADALLRGVPGVQTLLAAPALAAAIDEAAITVMRDLQRIEVLLDHAPLTGEALEVTNAALIAVKDAMWALSRDRVRNARAVGELLAGANGLAAVEAFTSVQIALSAIDRLEVRGRDSAGIHLLVRGHGLDLDSAGVAAMINGRATDPLFRDGAVRRTGDMLSFVYKAAAEIGELGDNVRALRRAITADELLHLAVAKDTAEVTVLGHTRWASVGIISQANAHPLNSEEDGGRGEPYAVAALNGDVDNFADLKASSGLRIAAEITTDAKVIPTLLSRRLRDGVELTEAFRQTVSAFEGSVAIGTSTAAAPDQLLLALRGSGQALYVGVADDAYIVASEPYGLVEETACYLRLDGETPADEANPNASRGQVVRLDGARAGTVDGIERIAYDGTPLPVTDVDLTTAQITTRDIDRGAYPHFLLKEISEAPASFRKTLRGKLLEHADGQLAVALGTETLSPDLRATLAAGEINRIVAIGQGTAHVAGMAFAAALRSMAPEHPVRVDALLATELSGFELRDDMGDTIVVAISQSGTTTDTNRTVDLARARGARVIAIVNRRNSDLTDKSDGVLYTSDGRDVEMSVASTKALYSQIAAGYLLAAAFAGAFGVDVDQALLAALRDLPLAMQGVIERRADIAAIAQQLAPPKRYWAIVGNGANRIAALELRIKLSELCYKAIACDSTEDKKHIDLSSEPLILVCAAGLVGSTADDVAKEVAIFRAHKATPIVICSDGEDRFSAALQAIKVPNTHPQLSFVLATMAGHVFGYEAALAIDAQALPLREARAAVEAEIARGGARIDGARALRALRPSFEVLAGRFFDGLRAGVYDGHLEASTAVRLASLFRYALGVTPLESYQVEYGRIGTPAVVIDDLTAALTRAIEELTRPIDAIKHQAKTVTVGISRSDETLLQVPLVSAVLAAGAPRDALSYKTLRTLAALDAAVESVTGSIRYRIEGDPALDDAVTASVIDRGGIAADIPSRTERDPVLRGTKHTVAIERELLVARGRRDGRTVIIIPETKDNLCTGITLLHVAFEDQLPVAGARSVLQGYRNRFAELKDAVTETEPSFREDLLAEQPVVDLLTLPVHELADRWRA